MAGVTTNGLGLAANNLGFDNQNVGAATQKITRDANGLDVVLPTGDDLGVTINSVLEYTMDATSLDVNTNTIKGSMGCADGDMLKYVSGTDTWTCETVTVAIPIIIDGGGATITTGIKGDIEVPFDCTITQWTALGDQTGSIVVDVWKDTYANYPPTVADTIAGSEKPTISSAVKGQDTSLTTWTTAVTVGDTIRYNVDSVTSIQRVTVNLWCDR